MPRVDREDSRVSRMLAAESFSFTDAVGGWRGLAESVLPGLVFVVAYLVWGGFKLPVAAAVATVLLMVLARLVQRTPVTQALSGTVGVVVGAVWAWTAGEPAEYFVPGLWTNAAYLAAVLVSILVRWPLVGVVVGLARGIGSTWRTDPLAMRRIQWATGVLASMFAFRLAVQVPLYLAGQVAALGTAKLAMGVPLFALTGWVVWLMVRNVGRVPERPDPRPPT